VTASLQSGDAILSHGRPKLLAVFVVDTNETGLTIPFRNWGSEPRITAWMWRRGCVIWGLSAMYRHSATDAEVLPRDRPVAHPCGTWRLCSRSPRHLQRRTRIRTRGPGVGGEPSASNRLSGLHAFGPVSNPAL